jgi:Beta-lactamase
MKSSSKIKDIKDINKWIKSTEARETFAKSKIDHADILKHVDALAKREKIVDTINSDVFTRSFRDFTLPINDIDPPVQLVGRHLDVNGFGQDLHQTLSSKRISGYTMKVRARGQDVYTLFWNWARKPVDPIALGWKPNVKMHIASVSKLITAMAVVKLLADKGISVDSPVAPHMPSYFKVGPGVAGITFRHLLTQTSGFRDDQNGGPNGGYTLKQLRAHFELGVLPTNAGNYGYYNGNFICLRIAMCTLMGTVNVSYNPFVVIPWLAQNSELLDLAWDPVSIAAYENYVTVNILTPSGVAASLQSTANDSLAYSSRHNENGKPLDSREGAGTDGWWLSVDELLSIMETFRSTSNIVPRALARQALTSGLGLEPFDWWQRDSWAQPDCMTKSGYWSDADYDGHTQQCIVAYAPPNYTLAVFVNSSILPPVTPGVLNPSKISYDIMQIVMPLLQKHIK